MTRHSTRRLDIHSELLSISSAIVLGTGVISLAMGAGVSGLLCIVAGVTLGVAGAFNHRAPTVSRRKIS